jgi:hypothetical protein
MFALIILIATMVFLLIFAIAQPFGKDWKDPKNQSTSKTPNICVLCGRPAVFMCPRCAWVQEGKDKGR